MSARQRRTDLATHVIRRVSRLLYKGAMNWNSGPRPLNPNLYGKTDRSRIAFRERATSCVVDMRSHNRAASYSAERIAHDGIAWGCGNCGEHAAVAFHVLATETEERPVDVFEWYLNDEHNHAFVVIGLPAGYARPEECADRDVVVCDPWLERAAPGYGVFGIEQLDARFQFAFGSSIRAPGSAYTAHQRLEATRVRAAGAGR